MQSLDTNVILRFTMRDVPDHLDRALDLLATAGARYLVSDAAIAEAVYAMEAHYQLDRAAVVDQVSAFLSVPSVEADRALHARVCQTYLRHPKLSFSDCLLAETADAAGATPLWTFDEKLAQQHVAARLVPLSERPSAK
ncbi:MAG: PIN domain-containing protein [Actinomycetia bacterium]|nr:PIN domain-containing protein [Actinomycetes bacterium]